MVRRQGTETESIDSDGSVTRQEVGQSNPDDSNDNIDRFVTAAFTTTTSSRACACACACIRPTQIPHTLVPARTRRGYAQSVTPHPTIHEPLSLSRCTAEAKREPASASVVTQSLEPWWLVKVGDSAIARARIHLDIYAIYIEKRYNRVPVSTMVSIGHSHG